MRFKSPCENLILKCRNKKVKIYLIFCTIYVLLIKYVHPLHRQSDVLASIEAQNALWIILNAC